MIDEMLHETKVADVWGIGKQYALMLNKNNIKTAYDFVQAPEDFIRKNMSIVGLRLQHELKGIPAIAFEELVAAKKNICTGRSFGKFTSDKKLIQEALSNFAANCGIKLRQQKSVAKDIRIFLNTNPHRTQDQQYFHSVIISMDIPTNHTPQIITNALKGLNIIFKEGYNYKKCGVEMLNVIPENEIQLNIFSEASGKKEMAISATLDKLNKSMGKELVRFGIQGFEKKYKARAAHLSPCYTTKLEHIIKINN
ncbi:MAG: DUF4113 domain-containing protein [Ferruginibacter sp.]